MALIGPQQGPHLGLRIVQPPQIGVKDGRNKSIPILNFADYMAASNTIKKRDYSLAFEFGYRNGYQLVWDLYTQRNRNFLNCFLQLRTSPATPLTFIDINVRMKFMIGSSTTTLLHTRLPTIIDKFTCRTEIRINELRDAMQAIGANDMTFHLSVNLYGSDHKEFGFTDLLVGDISKLLDNGTGSNFQIKVPTAPGSTLQYTRNVHRSILIARSPEFATMLRPNTIFTRTGGMLIGNMYPQALDAFLGFLYKGQMADCWMDLAITDQLLMAAQKFQIADIKNFYDRFLICLVDDFNVATCLTITAKYRLIVGARKILEYARTHKQTVIGSALLRYRL